MGEGTLAASLAGLAQALAPSSLVSLLVGVIVGGLVGVLPGLGGPTAVALLLPFVFDSPPQQAFALLIGLISVTSTTGDLTSILLGIPGEATTAATVVDGYPMAQRGLAGQAMGASLGSSLAGALFGALVMGLGVSAARPVSRLIGSPELFALAVLGVCCALPLASRSPLRGLASGALGLTLATIGLDPLTGTPRFTMGQLSLWDGVGLIPAALGLFAVPEIVEMLGARSAHTAVPDPGRGQFVSGLREVGRRWVVVLRACVIGTGVGLLPGVGATVSQWLAYADAARRSPNPDAFGRGAIDGVIAPSAANNATLGGALVPTLVLGVPGGLTSALFLTALIVKGLVPGRQMLLPERDGGHLELVFAFGWMMAIANIAAVAITWVASPWLVKVTRIRAAVLGPILVLLICVGAFSERNLMADLVMTVIMAVIGTTFAKFEWPRAPLLIGLVLGPLAENRLFVSIEAYGSMWWARPIVMLVGVVILGVTVHSLLQSARRWDSVGKPTAVQGLMPGESVLIAVLAGAGIVALGSTATFARQAAVFPRVSLALALTALTMLGYRGFRQPARAIGGSNLHLDKAALTATGWIAAFVTMVWAIGFTWGSVVAVAGMMAVMRERIRHIALIAGVTVVFMEVVLVRMLHVPFPAGAVFDGMKRLGVN